MSESLFTWLLILVALLAANLPWLTEKRFFLFGNEADVKPAWFRLLEWLILYFLVGGIALGLEKQMTGEMHAQDWEFYAVTVCLFLVFAMPGFIYRYDLRDHLQKARRRRR